MPCSDCLSLNWGTLPKYNATESDMQGTHCFREGGKRDREKCAQHQPRDQGVAGEGGGDLEGKRTEEPKWGNPSLPSEKGWIPSSRLSQSLLGKRWGGQRALRDADTFRGPGASRPPYLSGETRGVPRWLRGSPAREGQPEAEQSSARWTPKWCPARAPGKHSRSSAGPLEWGRGRVARGWKRDSPPSLDVH